MKRQFEHEDHNRQDKAKKDGYQAAFADPFDPGGSYELTIRLADIVHGSAAEKHLAQLHIEAARFVASTLRGAEHEVDGCRFRFQMSPEQFAKVNQLPINVATFRLRKVNKQATDRLAMTKQSVLRAEYESVPAKDSSDQTGRVLQLTFKNFLHQVTPIAWDHIYKTIHLNALNVA